MTRSGRPRKYRRPHALLPQVQRWKKSKRYRRMVKAHMAENPICVYCLEDDGVSTPAVIADHVIPHKGDQNLFWFGKLQSLCAHHHESRKKLEETRGYHTKVGDDGWPVDRRHPANRANDPFRTFATQQYNRGHHHQSDIPVDATCLIG